MLCQIPLGRIQPGSTAGENAMTGLYTPAPVGAGAPGGARQAREAVDRGLPPGQPGHRVQPGGVRAVHLGVPPEVVTDDVDREGREEK